MNMKKPGVAKKGEKQDTIPETMATPNQRRPSSMTGDAVQRTTETNLHAFPCFFFSSIIFSMKLM